MMMQCSTFDKSLEFLQREYFHDQGQLISLNECRVQTRCPFATRFCIFIFRPFPGRKWKRGMKSWERVPFNSWACAHHHGGVVAEGCRLSLGVMLLIRVSSVSRNGSSVSRHGESRTSIFSSLVLPACKAVDVGFDIKFRIFVG